MEQKKLTGVIELIKKSFRIYFKKENFIYLIKFSFISFLVILILLIPMGILIGLTEGVTKTSLPSLTIPYLFNIYVPLVVLLGLVVAIFGFWIQVVAIKATSQVVKGEIISVKETFKLAWPRVWKYFLVSLLTGLLISLGIILFIIPGIIFAVWFAFSSFIVVVESKGTLDSLRKSKELVKGYFWPVIGRFLVFSLLIMVIQIILSFFPVIGPIILLFVSPYYLLLPYLLYEDLKQIKG